MSELGKKRIHIEAGEHTLGLNEFYSDNNLDSDKNKKNLVRHLQTDNQFRFSRSRFCGEPIL